MQRDLKTRCFFRPEENNTTPLSSTQKTLLPFNKNGSKVRKYNIMCAAFTVLFCVSFAFSSKTRHFVKPGGNGNGSSWQDATNNLQAVLKKAKPGDEIWVAQGLFLPTNDFNRKTSFVIPNDVQVFGGFSGVENSLSERKPTEYPTVLSGNIGSHDMQDNTCNVVRFKGASEKTLLDGFVISGGYANDYAYVSGSRSRSGAGVYNDGSEKESTPTIRNCVFVDNFALDGGAVYNNAQKNGTAIVRFEHCQFLKNTAALDGGCLFNDGRKNGLAKAIFSHCIFKNNLANYGGAIFSFSSKIDSGIEAESCAFSENISRVSGGAVFQVGRESSGESKSRMSNCLFENNQAYHKDTQDNGFLMLD